MVVFIDSHFYFVFSDHIWFGFMNGLTNLLLGISFLIQKLISLKGI